MKTAQSVQSVQDQRSLSFTKLDTDFCVSLDGTSLAFVKVLKYLKNDLHSYPAFIILMNDGKEYFSFVECFIENTEDVISNEINLVKTKINSIDSECDITSIDDSSDMFYGCENLETVNINLPNAKYASYMFHNCTSLKTIDIDLPNAEDVSYMFHGCTNLKTIDITLPKAEDVNNMFRECTSLETFNINLPNAKDVTDMFYNCTNLDTKHKILAKLMES